MERRVNGHRAAGLLLLAALLMRAAVPVGYMPAAPGTGLLFELCPDGMPAGFNPSEGHAHHHHAAPDAAGEAGADQCQLGHMLSSAAAVGDSWQLDIVETLPVFSPMPTPPERGIAATAYRSRDPPA